MKRPMIPLLATTLLLPSLSSAISLDCSHIRTGDKKFNFKEIGGPHSVSVVEEYPPSVHNTTWTVDLCGTLKKTKDEKPEHQCPSGTYVCGIMTRFDKSLKDPTPEIDEVIPIAGSFATSTGKGLEPKFTRLESIPDLDARGLRIELFGGMYKKQRQRAVIDMHCDPERSGNERRDIVVREELEERDDDEKDDDGDKDDKDEGDTEKGSLHFVSYSEDADSKGKQRTLRLDWRTKYACESYEEDDDRGSKSKHWGFFTWFIVLLFLGISAYLIFGSWLNYNRYGARGWDLLPHGDTIRDVPYLFRDWSRRVVSTVQGGGGGGPGGRGGYSAV